jgi:hypothetical protein
MNSRRLDLMSTAYIRNSLDARATNIEIRVSGGGLSNITVRQDAMQTLVVSERLIVSNRLKTMGEALLLQTDDGSERDTTRQSCLVSTI